MYKAFYNIIMNVERGNFVEKQILEKIKSYNKIIIHRHVSPDPDAMGSQMGLFHIIKDNFPNKEVYITGVFPERLSYFKAHSRLKDNVFAGALTIVTDTANEERIDDSRYKLSEEIIKIDHHPITDQYGVINYVDTNASSTCEIVYKLCRGLNLEISDEAKEVLFAGMVADTNRFLYNSTTVDAFEIAMEMKKDNVNFEKVYNNLYKRNFNEMKYFGFILSNLVIKNRVARIVISNLDIDNNNVDIGTASNMIGELNNISDFYVWVFITEDIKANNYRVNIRSRGPVVNDVASKYGGGGHMYASGVRISKVERIEMLLNDLEERTKEFLNDR